MERVAGITAAEFNARYRNPGVPVVLTDQVPRWKAWGRWSADDLRARYGERVMDVEAYSGGDYYEPYRRDYAPKTHMTMSRFLDRLAQPRGNHRFYLGEVPLASELPALAAEVGPHPFIEEPTNALLWVGQDTVSPTHFHLRDQAALCQVVGTKTVSLYPPEDAQRMYPVPWYRRPGNFSRVNFDQPDLAEFPRFAELKPVDVVLRPGDMLFIPVHWWHLVRSAGFSMSVTVVWRARLRDWNMRALGARSAGLIVMRPILNVLRSRFDAQRLPIDD